MALGGFIASIIGFSSDSGIVGFLGLLIGGAASVYIVSTVYKAANQINVLLNNKIEQIISEEGFLGEKHISHGETTDVKVLSIDEERSTVLVIEIQGDISVEEALKNPTIHKIKFEDIIEVKVNSDSTTITSTSRGSQLGGALVGGVLAGGAGAVIGGLSGKTKSNESIKKLVLEIVVNSISNPVIEVPFYDSKIVELKAGTPQHDEITQKINLWYRKFTVILHQKDQKRA